MVLWKVFDNTRLMRLFEELDKTLPERHAEDVLIGGGSALICAGMDRYAHDVDSLLPLSPPLLAAIKTVGYRHGLYKWWFNDECVDVAPLPTFQPSPRMVYKGDRLTVSIPDLVYALAMKCAGARPEDLNDTVWLMRRTGITTQDGLLRLVEESYGQGHAHSYREVGPFVEESVRQTGVHAEAIP